ncbi:MAG: OmpA family protein [Pseudomonadota bacterium]|nr:OmpA family protein [Pseudomonadota bacterium]
MTDPLLRASTVRPLTGLGAALALATALAACGSDAERAPAPEPSSTETGVQNSIIRDDLADTEPLPPPPLAPLDGRIGFPEGGADLSESATADLDTLLQSPQMEAGGPIVLRAHSDAGGPGEANQRASQARGEAVRDYLVEGGVAEDRITIIAFGEQNPIAPNANPDGTPNERGRAANRRVEVHIALPGASEDAAPEEIEEAEPTVAENLSRATAD